MRFSLWESLCPMADDDGAVASGGGDGGGGGAAPPTTPSTPPAPPASPAPPTPPAPPAEDVTGLKNTVTALRSELAAAQARLNQYGDLDPTQAKEALAQLPTLQTELQAVKLETGLGQVTTGVLPAYAELITARAGQLLTVGEGGAVVGADGRSLADIQTDLKSKFPFAFAADNIPAGAGTTASNGSAAATPTVVQAPNGVIQGVDPDAVIKGTVTIQ